MSSRRFYKLLPLLYVLLVLVITSIIIIGSIHKEDKRGSQSKVPRISFKHDR